MLHINSPCPLLTFPNSGKGLSHFWARSHFWESLYLSHFWEWCLGGVSYIFFSITLFFTLLIFGNGLSHFWENLSHFWENPSFLYKTRSHFWETLSQYWEWPFPFLGKSRYLSHFWERLRSQK